MTSFFWDRLLQNNRNKMKYTVAGQNPATVGMTSQRVRRIGDQHVDAKRIIYGTQKLTVKV